MKLTLSLASLAFLAFAATPARTHEYWIAPSRYEAAAGDTLSFSAWVGNGFPGERKFFDASRTESLTLHATRELDLRLATTDGDSVFGRAIFPDDSGAVVTFVSRFTSIELPGARFEGYLAEEGLDAVSRARARKGQSDRPGHERYRRCAKTWVAGAAASRRLFREAGLPLEITPVDDPRINDRVTFRVTCEGEPLRGALLQAWRVPLGRDFRPQNVTGGPIAQVHDGSRTDGRGEATLTIDAPGEWLVGAVHMIPSRAPEEADWESTWATLTFGRPAGGGFSPAVSRR